MVFKTAKDYCNYYFTELKNFIQKNLSSQKLSNDYLIYTINDIDIYIHTNHIRITVRDNDTRIDYNLYMYKDEFSFTNVLYTKYNRLYLTILRKNFDKTEKLYDTGNYKDLQYYINNIKDFITLEIRKNNQDENRI